MDKEEKQYEIVIQDVSRVWDSDMLPVTRPERWD